MCWKHEGDEKTSGGRVVKQRKMASRMLPISIQFIDST